MIRSWIPAALGALVLVAGATAVSAWQVQQGKSRKAATKYLMRGMIKPNCAGLGKLLKEGPADDKAWDNVICHASCLNELGHTMMADGRCPDGTWAKASKALRECSATVLMAAKNKDLEAARAAFKGVTASCKTCHEAHKKK